MVEAMFSFKPKWANAILHGTKTVELRTTAPKKEISKAWIYASFPTQKIVGWFIPGKVYPPMDTEALYATFGYEAVMGYPCDAFDEHEIMLTALGPKPGGEVTIGQTIGATKKYRAIEINCSMSLEQALKPPGLGIGRGPLGTNYGWRPPISWRYLSEEDAAIVRRAVSGGASDDR